MSGSRQQCDDMDAARRAPLPRDAGGHDFDLPEVTFSRTALESRSARAYTASLSFRIALP